MNGFDSTSTALSLAKQILMDCEGNGDISIPKETLKNVLNAFIQTWQGEQDRKRSEFKKAAI